MIANQIQSYEHSGVPIINELNLTITDMDNDGYSVGYDGYDGENKDCDDSDAEINVKTTYYVDADDDGYGDDSNATVACIAPVGYVSDNTDCNDDNVGINPGATDVCGNGIAEDCSADVTCPAAPSSGGSSGGGGSTCYTEWDCTDWSECIDEEQTRTCEKEKIYCRTTIDKPIEVQTCIVQEEEPEVIEVSSDEDALETTPGITGAVIGGGRAKIYIPIIFIVLVGAFGITIYFRKKKKIS